MEKFDFSMLREKIKQAGYRQVDFAHKIGVCETTLVLKLGNKSPFTSKEILTICRELGLGANDIPVYFFNISL